MRIAILNRTATNMTAAQIAATAIVYGDIESPEEAEKIANGRVWVEIGEEQYSEPKIGEALLAEEDRRDGA